MSTIRPVNPRHERTEKGVLFNVETVDTLGGFRTPLTSYDSNAFVNQFYKDYYFSPQVEVSSFHREPIFSPVSGFAHVALEAFAYHYPLIIRPDDIWLLLTYGFANHVEKNAECLRKNFVQHEGKKKLVVQVDHFVLGKMQPEDWERDVFPDFSRQIREHIGEHTHSVIAGEFTTTSVTDKAAHEITLMAAMKEYFSYGMSTFCGIPYIELSGSEQDWINVRDRAKKLCTLMVPREGQQWDHVLGPVLDQFVLAYQGNVNHHFWQSMVKKIQHGQGSGSYSTISGWITILYLTLQQYHKNWEDMIISKGPEPSQFPRVVSSAPVTWEYYGKEYSLHFHAGYYGIKQDQNTRAIQSCIGWIVSHDPPSGEARIQWLETEIARVEVEQNKKDWKLDGMKKELKKLKSGK